MLTISEIKNIQIEDYNYPLTDDRVAKYPIDPRDSSKLLYYKNGVIQEDCFSNIAQFIESGSILVRNNTKVIRARLFFYKSSGAKVEIFCLDPLLPITYEQNLAQRETCVWHCLVGNSKKWKRGKLQCAFSCEGKIYHLEAERALDLAPDAIRFSWDSTQSFAVILEKLGVLPIPPYLNRATEESDLKSYQTIYALQEGSVAAPTAGLHFTQTVFDTISAKGIDIMNVTLHVGAGTFKPVKSEDIGSHQMHAESIVIERNFIERMRASTGAIIAVGTTSVRTLESLYYIALKLKKDKFIEKTDLFVEQWEPYEKENLPYLSRKEVFDLILEYLDLHQLSQLQFQTGIMIAPGYQYKIISGLITNFHQPKSTLLLLVSALIGEDWKKVYAYALAHQFRFLSYGDSSLLMRDCEIHK